MALLRFWKGILLALVVMSTSGYAQEKEKLYLLTLPKSGTHCLEKYFDLLKYRKVEIPYAIKRSHMSESALKLPKNHFVNTWDKKIILVRDLRDLFISALNHVETKQHWLNAPVYFTKEWKSLSFEDKILELIDYTKLPKHIHWKHKDRRFPQQMQRMIKKAMVYSHFYNALLIHYENLSGGLGRKIQRDEMRKINQFLNLSLAKQDETFLIDHLFGNRLIPSSTFNKGEIGTWKSLMSARLCRRIQELYGEELTYFGYEAFG